MTSEIRRQSAESFARYRSAALWSDVHPFGFEPAIKSGHSDWLHEDLVNKVRRLYEDTVLAKMFVPVYRKTLDCSDPFPSSFARLRHVTPMGLPHPTQVTKD